MINLIKFELKKIFHKKSFLIVTIIFLLYCVLTNVIYKNIDEYYEETNIEELKEINNSLNLKNEEEFDEYLSNLTEIKIYELQEKYPDNTKKYLINKYLYDLIYESNKYQENNNASKKENNSLMEEYLNKIAQGDWQYFANLEIEEVRKSLAASTDSYEKNKYEELLKLENYRLNNNLGYDQDNFLVAAIEAIETDITEYYNLQRKEHLTKEEQERFDYIREEMAINNYILEHQKDINNSKTLQAVLKNFPNEFGLFILIFVIMICGSIVSEEFNKGTIKYLLTKPYKRSTILTSKLLTVMLLIPLIILIMSIIEIIIGGLILDFKSLGVPVVIYNSASNTLITKHILSYMLMLLLSNLTIYIFLGVLCFTLSAITSSTSAAITITFLFYLIGNVISNLALVYKFKLFKAFISLHWDFSYLVNLSSNPYQIKPIISVMVILIYIVALLCCAYAFFCKKDVKNI